MRSSEDAELFSGRVALATTVPKQRAAIKDAFKSDRVQAYLKLYKEKESLTRILRDICPNGL
jgi:hypothetical protein